MGDPLFDWICKSTSYNNIYSSTLPSCSNIRLHGNSSMQRRLHLFIINAQLVNHWSSPIFILRNIFDRSSNLYSQVVEIHSIYDIIPIWSLFRNYDPLSRYSIFTTTRSLWY